jgi:hypothetical protein
LAYWLVEAHIMSHISTEAESEDAFRLLHGMTRKEWAEKVRPYVSSERLEDSPATDVSGEFPKNSIKRRGLPPQRARLVQFHAWRIQEERNLADLQTLKMKMQGIVAKPEATEAEIRDEVKKSAARLMDREPGAGIDTANRKQLGDRLASERYAGEAAREALSQIENNIAVAELRLSRLNLRESEFMRPALIECAEELGLGKLYLKKIAELKQVSELLFGLDSDGIEYKSRDEHHFKRAEAVKFPLAFLTSAGGVEPDLTTIRSHGRPDLWKQLGRAILLSPDMDVGKFIALPK